LVNGAALVQPWQRERDPANWISAIKEQNLISLLMI